MVGYYQAYKGSSQTPLIYANSRLVKKVHKGSNLIYQIGFSPVTFSPSSSLQSFEIPPGVSKIHVDCVASKGRDVTNGGYTGKGGKGGRVQCDLSVQGGETLYIMVGNIPTSETPTYNASDIRIGGNSLANRVIVAGGGGGGSVSQGLYQAKADGGGGGGTTGGTGANTLSVSSARGGAGGTQSAGGHGAGYTDGYYGTAWASDGTLGLGGAGVRGGNTSLGLFSAGGAGYYGGGGGYASYVFFHDSAQGGYCGGAGGGSSYTNANCSNVVHTQGYNDGAGYVTISFVE